MLVPKEAIGVVEAASRDSASRFDLQSVKVEQLDNGMARAVATDGKKMAIVTWSEPDRDNSDTVKESYQFSAVQWKSFGNLFPKKMVDNAYVNIQGQELGTPGIAKVTYCGAASTSLEVTLVDDNFPDVYRLQQPVAKEHLIASLLVSVDHLTRLLKVAKQSTAKKVTLGMYNSGCLKISGNPVNREDIQVEGALMGMSDKENDYTSYHTHQINQRIAEVRASIREAKDAHHISPQEGLLAGLREALKLLGGNEWPEDYEKEEDNE